MDIERLILNRAEVFWLSDGKVDPNDNEVAAELFDVIGATYLQRAAHFQDLTIPGNTGVWEGTLVRTAMDNMFKTWKNLPTTRQNAKPAVWRLDCQAMLRQFGWCRDCGGGV